MSRGERPTEAASRWVAARSGGEWQEGETLPRCRVSSGVRGIFWNCVEVVVYNIVDMLKATKVVTLKVLILCDFTSIN